MGAVSTTQVNHNVTRFDVRTGKVEKRIGPGRIETDVQALVHVSRRRPVHACELLEVLRWHLESLLHVDQDWTPRLMDNDPAASVPNRATPAPHTTAIRVNHPAR